MKFRSCDCRRIDLPDDDRWTALLEAGEGAFSYGTQRHDIDSGPLTTIMIHVPYTAVHDSIHTLRIYREGDEVPPTPAWLWDGNRDAPTLEPSIACGPEGERDWHGYMTAGRMKACE